MRERWEISYKNISHGSIIAVAVSSSTLVLLQVVFMVWKIVLIISAWWFLCIKLFRWRACPFGCMWQKVDETALDGVIVQPPYACRTPCVQLRPLNGPPYFKERCRSQSLSNINHSIDPVSSHYQWNRCCHQTARQGMPEAPRYSIRRISEGHWPWSCHPTNPPIELYIR